MRWTRAIAVVTGVLLLSGVASGLNASALTVGGPAVRCDAVAGSASISPGLSWPPRAQTLQLESFHVSKCGPVAPSTTIDVSGTLRSASASCPAVADESYRGSLQLAWQPHGFVSTIKRAHLTNANKADDPDAMRLRGIVTGGADLGLTLDVVLDLTPTQGDCETGVTDVAITNASALTVGGPDARCDSVAGTASASPGVTWPPRAQTLQLESFHVSKCGPVAPSTSIDVSGTLTSTSASCPPVFDESYRGTLHLAWKPDGFLSTIKHALLTNANKADDPDAMRLRGIVTGGADLGLTLDVALDLTPTQGTCETGITDFAVANASALTVGGPVARCDVVAGSASISPGLSWPPGAQTLALETFHVSKCGPVAPSTSIDVTGTLTSASASCPPVFDESYRGSLHLAWQPHGFVSTIDNARLTNANDPNDGDAMRLRGIITGGADLGLTFDVVLDLTPTQGTCETGITQVAITNAH